MKTYEDETAMRILIADDQNEIRSALRLLLRHELNLTAFAEASDAEGLLALECEAPDVVLLDWELPDGRERAREGGAIVHALRDRWPGVFVIAMSGRLEAREAAREAGVDAFVSKGSPASELLKVLRGLG